MIFFLSQMFFGVNKSGQTFLRPNHPLQGDDLNVVNVSGKPTSAMKNAMGRQMKERRLLPESEYVVFFPSIMGSNDRNSPTPKKAISISWGLVAAWGGS